MKFILKTIYKHLDKIKEEFIKNTINSFFSKLSNFCIIYFVWN